MNWAKDELLRQEEEAKGTGACECTVCGQRFDSHDGDEDSMICPDCWARKMEKD